MGSSYGIINHILRLSQFLSQNGLQESTSPYSIGSLWEILEVLLFQEFMGIEISVLINTRFCAEKQYCKKIKLVPSLRTLLFLITNLMGCRITVLFWSIK